MLTDPMSITIGGSAKTLPRAGGYVPGIARRLSQTNYRDSTDEYFARITQSVRADGGMLAEFILGRTTPDPDPDPFLGYRGTNYVGLVVSAELARISTGTDIPLLRTALNTFVDSTMLNRLIGGES